MGFVTITEYKAAGIIETSAQDGDYPDAQIQVAINAATSFLESEAYQPLSLQAEEEILRTDTEQMHVGNDGALYLYPKFFPVDSITSITYRYSPSQLWTDPGIGTLDPTDYSVLDVRPSGYSWGAEIIVPEVSPFRRNMYGEVDLKYQAGYSTIPNDLKYACHIWTAGLLSIGYSAASAEMKDARDIIPPWAWAMTEEIIANYQRGMHPVRKRFSGRA